MQVDLQIQLADCDAILSSMKVDKWCNILFFTSMKVEEVTMDFYYGGTWLMSSHCIVEVVWTTGLQLKVKCWKMAVTLQLHCSYVFVMLLYIKAQNIERWMTKEWQWSSFSTTAMQLYKISYMILAIDMTKKIFMNN
jgi:hypothetical protein